MQQNKNEFKIHNRTTFDDIYCKRNRWATVDNQFIDIPRNVQEAHELVRLQKA